MSKKNIAILFGGKSPEHEVSIVSAKNIYNAVNKEKFNTILIGISTEGKWFLEQATHHQKEEFIIGQYGNPLFIVPGDSEAPIRFLNNGESIGTIDVVFPITHGPNGEDGNLQGLLNQIQLPFVGPDVLGSAVAMDKAVCKNLFQQANIGCAEGVVLHKHLQNEIDYDKIAEQLGDVLFIKPANMGSSIGVNRSTDRASFEQGIADAFLYDTKIIIEKSVTGRELECAVLGNEFPKASTVGEVIMVKGFYDFESKYVSADNAIIQIPAKNLDSSTIQKIQKVAIRAYQCLNLEGLSRVDVFLTPDNEVIVNEVNTLPGFTSISMYPKLWENSSMEYKDLITELLNLGIKRAERKQTLKSTRL